MKKSIKILILLAIITIFYIFVCNVQAASSYVTVSKSSANVGDTFTVTVAGNAASWNIKLNYSGPVSLVSGSLSDANATSSGNNENATFVTATFKATGEGTATFSASGQLVNSDYSSSNAGGSKTVSITSPKPVKEDPQVVTQKPAPQPTNTTTPKPTQTEKEEKKSNDAKLKEIKIEEGAISPEFSADVKEYKIVVPNEITALNIVANPNDSKAKVSIEGNKDFIVGENKITIKVVAEDATTNEYYITVIRQRTSLSLATLKITYTDTDGNLKEIELNPAFNPTVLEYDIGELSYLINSLDIEAIANLEDAIIEISGNDDLQAGDNIITIKITMKAEEVAEGEEQPEDEVIIYTIKLKKEEKPTLIAKISNWFKGIFGGVANWYGDNKGKVIIGELGICNIALIGLSVYIVVDYNKYKDIIAKVNKVEKFNEVENASEEETSNGFVNDYNKPKVGKHF